MSKIQFTTKVVGLNEEVEELATNIARFLGRPLSADDLSLLSSYYTTYMLYAKKISKCTNRSAFKVYLEYYDLYRKQFYDYLAFLRQKYDTQKTFDFKETTSHIH